MKLSNHHTSLLRSPILQSKAHPHNSLHTPFSSLLYTTIHTITIYYTSKRYITSDNTVTGTPQRQRAQPRGKVQSTTYTDDFAASLDYQNPNKSDERYTTQTIHGWRPSSIDYVDSQDILLRRPLSEEGIDNRLIIKESAKDAERRRDPKKGYLPLSMKAREFLQSQSDHMQFHVVDQEWMGQRVDDFVLQHYPDWSYESVRKLVEQGHIYRYRNNGKKTYTRLTDRVKLDELICVPTSAFWQNQISPPSGIVDDPRAEERKAIHLSSKAKELARDMVLFKNEHVIVINKPNMIPMNGGRGVTINISDLLPALKFTRSEKPIICHKLDEETSGCVLLARTPTAHRMLAKTFMRRVAPNSVYWGFCVGKPSSPHGRIRMFFEEDGKGRIIARPTPSPGARVALSEYVVNVSALEYGSFISFYPLSSRRHQLRIMAAHALRCPLLGDAKFGGENAFPKSLSVFWDVSKRDIPLHLHHRKVQLPYKNAAGKYITVSAEVPMHMRNTMAKMGWPCDVDDPLIPG